MLKQSLTAAFALLMPVACLVGCGDSSGPELGKVSGTVTLDGAPLAGATVEFHPQGEGVRPSFGATDADGGYELMFLRDKPGAPVGMNTVMITVDPPQEVPAKYNKSSELTADVKSGSNQFDFNLTSE